MGDLNKTFINKDILKGATKDSIKKLDFKNQLKNPVMFIVYVGSIITSIISVLSIFNITNDNTPFTITISIFLWSTVLFANFAEAIAEGRGKAQASSLRAAKKDVLAKKLKECNIDSEFEMIPSNLLKKEI
ncbi:hypothetical protein [Romboutsia sp. 1001216sp1]|uniref:hypothetical protein n=1 Tax=Romboutsia sp. 1001216sp1 TaxID=2986997 RepID=UPI002ED4CD3E